MLVYNSDNNTVLLSRKAAHPRGIWTCIAGFVDVGESIEEAVVREVKEEAGIDVSVENVEYIASQPWPFLIGQLMVGCFARVSSSSTGNSEQQSQDHLKITVDKEELEDAQWFSVAKLREALQNSSDVKSDFRMPPRHAVAHILGQVFLQRFDSSQQQQGDNAVVNKSSL